jgi:hypothetical protein
LGGAVKLPGEFVVVVLAEFHGAVADDKLGLVANLGGAALDEGGILDGVNLGAPEHERPLVGTSLPPGLRPALGAG